MIVSWNHLKFHFCCLIHDRLGFGISLRSIVVIPYSVQWFFYLYFVASVLEFLRKCLTYYSKKHLLKVSKDVADAPSSLFCENLIKCHKTLKRLLEVDQKNITVILNVSQ